ncbi:MAG: DUF1080 domain-containing protein [Planctomycetes bacterium]|nr:DUF1080 domain-containing protein [Planctomycetota bacterium]
MRLFSRSAILLGLSLCASSALFVANRLSVATAADSKGIVAITIEEAKKDPDFAIQGEYEGDLGGQDEKQKWGLQIIAQGDGKFRAVAYPGGLPGAGWDKEKKIQVDGTAKDGVATFNGEQGSATIKDGVAKITSPDGNPLGEMKKVERKSPTIGKKAPDGAVVLFDGKNGDAFTDPKKFADGLMSQGITSKQKFGDFSLHMEFLLSYMPAARGQGRANSGCYMQGRYEVQILDSFGLSGENNECGGIYTIAKPSVNMCLPPLAWQTYDVDYTAAKYDGDKKTANAKMTVRHNGIVIHENVELPKATTAAPVAEGPETGPIYIQDHGNPIRFRNIWLVEKK